MTDASQAIARLRELHAEHLKAAGPFKSPRNRRPLDHLRLAELDRDFVAAASVALPALLECAEALAGMIEWFEPPAIAIGGMYDGEREALTQARAALDALSKDTP
jgi:hypothetical protein